MGGDPYGFFERAGDGEMDIFSDSDNSSDDDDGEEQQHRMSVVGGPKLRIREETVTDYGDFKREVS